MKKIFLAAAIGAIAMNVQAQEISKDHADARAMVKEYGGQLKGALQEQMKAGGPVGAIGVCSQKAPAIAQAISDKHAPWQATRVSLKPRGANATADAWETQTLKWFADQVAAGADLMKLEKFEIVKIDGKEVTRYMKPLATAGLCLTCHGTADKIPATVKQKLVETYPNDQATGYGEGQVIGAFSFQK